MTVIDADCHVIESDRTWEYFDKAEMRHRPPPSTTSQGSRSASPAGEARHMAIDGRPHAVLFSVPRGDRREELAGYSKTTEASRMLTDVSARLRHMDELGVDIQVLYPTLFLTQLTARAEVEAALTRSYNRWLGDIWKQAGGRLRWVAVPPLLGMPETLSQVRRAVDHGACGILMRGFEDQRILSDPYFFPLYEEARELDVPICIHAGGANPSFEALVREPFSAASCPRSAPFTRSCSTAFRRDSPGCDSGSSKYRHPGCRMC